MHYYTITFLTLNFPLRLYNWNWTAGEMLAETRKFAPWYRKLYGIYWKIERRQV